MTKILFLSAFVLLAACGKNDQQTTDATTSAASETVNSDAEFFAFELDGKPMQIAPADISSSFYPSGELKIYAGADRAMSVILTIPEIEKCPCSVPAGALDAASPIGQGSISLQSYPHPHNGLNSWYVGQAGVPSESAIEITAIGPVQNGGRMISGRFNVLILKTESNGDGPENKDYQISGGRFQIKHDVVGQSGF